MSKKQTNNYKSSWVFPEKKISIPKIGTLACKEYFISWLRINRFLHYILNMVIHIELTSRHAHETLVDVANNEKEREKLLKEWESRTGPIDELKKHRQFLIEITLVRHIENYLNYISSLLKEIFIQRPETLRSSEKIDLEIALKHDSISDLVRTVAEKKVESLSYSSFQDLYNFFKDRFNLVMFEDNNIPDVVDAIETRNIVVHNRCVINQQFIKRTGVSENELGKLRILGTNYLEKHVPILAESVKRLDRDARKHLKISGTRFSIDIY